MDNNVEAKLADPEFIWEAISIDGVSYPFNDSRFGLTGDERLAVVKKVAAHDNQRAIDIGHAILHNDKDALFDLISKQLIDHAERVIEVEMLELDVEAMEIDCAD